MRGPQREKTKKIAIGLKKKAKSSKKRIYARLAEELLKPRRKKKPINLWKLCKLAKKFPGRWLVTASKVLGYGKVDTKIKVIGFEFSSNAIAKLKSSKSEFLTLEEMLNSKINPSEMVIVK
ncbi:MAG: hypothetical protein DRO04_01460 [Candidatus Iainarchaeum archaeon]|uniref:Large ribosomal subunit protein uL15/eL18 domain-containing protein n=1 Tax=Candidatus Iainarchaeum sp. TaxID=3101447 RepID=A0A497JIX8_9ARCH|nr:MAG: hypothetical protein DRO04_01460 [Candidatus Diapherotrites archaeon]